MRITSCVVDLCSCLEDKIDFSPDEERNPHRMSKKEIHVWVEITSALD